MTDFAQMTYDDAAALIPAVDAESEAFANGDHWQNGDGWTGPKLSSDDPLSSDVTDFLEGIFVVEDVLNEILERHTQGVVGRAFVWYVTGENEGIVGEVQQLLQPWLESRNGKAIIEEAVRNTLWSERGPIRLYVPLGKRDEAGNIPKEPFAESLNRIFIEAPHPSSCSVVQDPDTKQEGGVYLFKQEDEDVAEIVFTDKERLTTVRTTDGEAAPPLDFGGALTMFEMRRKTMVTTAQKSKQKFLNHIMTAAQASISVAGWPEDFFFNAAMPGTWEQDSNGVKTFKPDTFKRGPGTANFLVGVSSQAENGSEVLATPQHKRQEPTNPDTFIKLKDELRASMLNRAHQGHTLLTGIATASAEKLVKSKGEYEASLSTTKEQVDRALTWLLETAVAMAVAFSGEAKYAGLQVVSDTQLDVGVISLEERRIVADLQKGGFISQRTALGWAGVDDVDGEMALLEQEGQAATSTTPTPA